MSIKVWPLDAVSGSPDYTGRMLRQTLAPLFGPAPNGRPLGAVQGIRSGTANPVSASTSTWTVTPHAGVVDVEVSASAGAYVYASDANVTGSMTAPNGTNPRIDLISFTLADPAEDGSGNAPGGTFTYTAGTAAATPAAPATPSLSMAIATIYVPASGGGSPTTTLVASYFTTLGPDFISDCNTATAAGFWYCGGTGSNQPVSGDAYNGVTMTGNGAGVLIQLAWRVTASATIEQWQRVFDGTTWNPWSQTAGQPNFPSDAGITLASGYSARSGAYFPRAFPSNGNKVEMRGGIAKNSGTIASGGVTVGTLDSALWPSELVEFSCACTATSDFSTVRLEITSAGVMTVWAPVSGDVAWVSLDGCYFYTS